MTPAGGGVELLVVRLPHGAEAPGLARDAMALLGERLGGSTDEAAVLVSELVTNAVRHGRALPDGGGGIELRITTAPGGERVAVRDGGGPTPPAVRSQAAPSRPGGRGLWIVDALAARWGYTWAPGATEAWFTTGAPAAAPAVAAAARELAGSAPGAAGPVLGALTAMSESDRVELWEPASRGLVAVAAAFGPGLGRVDAGHGAAAAVAAATAAGTAAVPTGEATALAVRVGDGLVLAAITRADPAAALANALVPAAELLAGGPPPAPAAPVTPVLGELAFLSEASHLLASSLDYDETLARVAQLFVPARADWVTVNVIEDDGSIRRVAVAHRDPEARPRLASMLDRHPHDPDADTGVPLVIRRGEPLLFADVAPAVLEETANDPEYLAITRDLQIESCVIVPLLAKGRVLGTMSIVSTESARLRFGDADLALAAEIGRRAGVAIENARRYRDRSYLAAALARTLLPDELPEVAGLELAVRYVPATRPAGVGGDFYDVVAGSDGEWYLLVGDVQGKGPDAATLIGLARHTLRTAAMRGDPPAVALQTLNQALLAASTDRACTAICVRVDTVRDRRVATVARAGHPAPFLVRVARAVRAVEPDGLLLGVRRVVDLEEASTTLLAGDALVLYTDGIYGRDDAGAEERLAAKLGESVGGGAEDLAAAALSVAGDTGYDDLTVLVARVR